MSRLQGTDRLMASIIYGAGLRLEECLSLRIRDVDFERSCLTIRCGKGNKDRETGLPEKMVAALRRHLEKVQAIYESDRRNGIPGVQLPEALGRKFPAAEKERGWFWVFPSQFRDPSRRTRIRHSYNPGIAGAFGCIDHDDLHSRCRQEQAWRHKSCRRLVWLFSRLPDREHFSDVEGRRNDSTTLCDIFCTLGSVNQYFFWPFIFHCEQKTSITREGCRSSPARSYIRSGCPARRLPLPPLRPSPR